MQILTWLFFPLQLLNLHVIHQDLRALSKFYLLIDCQLHLLGAVK